MSGSISAVDAKALVHDGEELALLDVREMGEFGDGHPLLAVPCPYSRLEARIQALVPRRSARVLLIDGGDGVAARAATALGRLGYGQVSWIDGGAPAWAAARFTLFEGVNVPSKTLGELAEAAWHPSMLDADTLVRWRAERRDFQLFDVRPPSEHAKMRIPGAICLPNGELAHRLAVAVQGAAPVVVACAGRTRGIIGALSLRLMGAEPPILALENGTQGWALAGHALERGNQAAPFPELDEAAKQVTRARADAFLARHDIPVITAAQVQALRAQPERTTYLFDVRSADEVANLTGPAFTPAPCGQLVQATDQWVGVRRAQLVLADDLGLRAGLAAYWLRLLGYDVAVVRIDDALCALPVPGVEAAPARPDAVRPDVALRTVGSGHGHFVDLRPSADFRSEHVAGALWGIRPRLDRLPIGRGTSVYLIGDDPAIMALAAREFQELGQTAIHAVEGGQAALKSAGAAVEATVLEPDPEEAIDFVRFAHGRHDGNLDASRLYLAWEQGLINRLDQAERAEFGIRDIASS